MSLVYKRNLYTAFHGLMSFALKAYGIGNNALEKAGNFIGDPNAKPKEKKPVAEYLKMQGRFAHMFKPGNEWMIEEVQKEVDRNWEELLKLCEL